MSVFAAIRADPGGLSLNTMLSEVEKLLAGRPPATETTRADPRAASS